MLLSDQHQFVFIHVPKTGGDSISAALRQHADGVDASAGDRKHWNARRTREALFGETHGRAWGEYTSFGVIRNPWDQVHSDYHFCRQSPDPGPEFGNWRFKVLRTKQIDFPQFVEETCGTHGRAGSSLWHHYLCDRNGRQMITHVLKHERLRDDWPVLCEALGIAPMQLPRLNVTHNRPDYRHEYDSRSRYLVSRRFAADIEHFGYTFDGFRDADKT